MKLFDSELKVMAVLWREGDSTAKHISDVLGSETGWNVNTTYTVIERREPNFLCHALVSKAQIQAAETDELIEKIYDGSADMLFASLLDRKRLSAEQIERLKRIVEEGK